MKLFSVESQSFYRDELANKVSPTVYAVGEDAEAAKKIAIEKFKEAIEDQGQSFDELTELNKEDLEMLAEDDVSMPSLFEAACGKVRIVELGSASDVIH